MKTLATQRRLAAEVLGIGKGRVWFDPEKLTDIGEALTKADIEELIKDKAIKAKPIAKRIKRKEGRERRKTKKRKRRKTGRIKMKIKRRKQRYVKRIRKLRNYLKMLKSKAAITIQQYHDLRRLAKAGQFKSRRELQDYVQNILKKIAKKTVRLAEKLAEKPKEKPKRKKAAKAKEAKEQKKK